MKIYLCGPVTGTDDYRERFAAAELEVMRMGHTAVNPTKLINMAQLEAWGIEFEHGDWMTCTGRLLNHCDGIYFMRGWEKSVGCLQEAATAKYLKIEFPDFKFIYEEAAHRD